MTAITIEQCPICGFRHKYGIAVRQVPVLLSRQQGAPQNQERKFTRVFTCPKNSAEFQASFFLTEPAGKKIKTVAVADS
jgi:hypothetical protein